MMLLPTARFTIDYGSRLHSNHKVEPESPTLLVSSDASINASAIGFTIVAEDAGKSSMSPVSFSDSMESGTSD